MVAERAAALATADGVSLDARRDGPEQPRLGIVVCHPHPLYGGDMDNPVVVRVAEACAALGLATLRFNFRGVGRSSGTHDHGRGEARDVEAAWDHLAGAVGGRGGVVLAGYSFGATVVAGAAAAASPAPAGLVLIAPPLAVSGPDPFTALATVPGPVLLVAGTRDELCPRPALDALAGGPRTTLRVIEGADHFFLGRLYPLGEAVAGWVGAL